MWGSQDSMDSEGKTLKKVERSCRSVCDHATQGIPSRNRKVYLTEVDKSMLDSLSM